MNEKEYRKGKRTSKKGVIVMSKPWENNSGCSDPTAYAATKQISEEDQRVNDLIRTIKAMIRLAGFELEGRIVLCNRHSGRTYR